MAEGKRSKRQMAVINDFGGGLQSFTSPFLLQANESPFIENVEVRQPGILTKALGYSQLGSVLSSGTVSTGVDFTTNDSGAWYPNTDNKDIYAQSFTTIMAGTITQIQLYLKKNTDSLDSPAKVLVSLVGDSGGTPVAKWSNVTWYEAVVSSTSYSWITIPVSFAVEDATKYWIIARLYYLETL